MKTRDVGELVKIRTDLDSGRYYGNELFISEMGRYCGKFLVVAGIAKRIVGNSYKMFGNRWMWSDAMIDDSFDEEENFQGIDASELFSSFYAK